MVSVCLPSDALLQHLPSYLGFSYIGHGVFLHGCSSKAQLLFQKVGETARPFRYDLNQIPYDYTVEVRNRLKGLDLIDKCLMNYGMRFMTLYRRQGSRPSPWKRNAEKERYSYLNAEFQRIARRDKKAFLSDQCKEIEKSNRMGKTKISSRKLEIPREHFMQIWA